MIIGNVIYNALPYIYTAGGVATLLLSSDPIGYISGLLLISAAMMVFHLRLEYRTKWAEQSDDALHAAKLHLAEIRREDG